MLINNNNENNNNNNNTNTIPFEDFGGEIIYDLEQKHTINEIISNSEIKNLYKNETTKYFSLIDELELPNLVTNLCLSKNGEFLFIGGSHPPQFVCFELENFCEKSRQHTYYHMLKMISLPTDPFKVVCLYENRYVEFFYQQGKHEKIRVPKFCHDMIYNETNCDLYIYGYENKIWRFNLELGQFLKPFELSKNFNIDKNSMNDIDEILCGDLNPINNLFGVGCSNGFVECIDPRQKKICGVINCAKSFNDLDNDITKLTFDTDGLSFAIGTISGKIGLFDLRKDGILLTKDHQNESKITSLIFHQELKALRSKKKIISSDRFNIKIWDKQSGKNITNTESKGRINDIIVYPNSGLIFCAQEREKVTPYYIPCLGPTPYWCSFLNSFIGDIESKKKKSLNNFVSPNYSSFETKFVSHQELKKLGLQSMIGSEFIKPHLHGYLININFLNKINKK